MPVWIVRITFVQTEEQRILYQQIAENAELAMLLLAHIIVSPLQALGRNKMDYIIVIIPSLIVNSMYPGINNIFTRPPCSS